MQGCLRMITIMQNSWQFICYNSNSESPWRIEDTYGKHFCRTVTSVHKILKVTKFPINFSSFTSFSAVQASPEIWNTLGLLHRAFHRSLWIGENPHWQWKGYFLFQCHIPLEHTAHNWEGTKGYIVKLSLRHISPGHLLRGNSLLVIFLLKGILYI